MRRLCIFVIYDYDGVVDEYIFYLFKSLRAENIDINVVVNGNLKIDCEKKLNDYAARVIVRENHGYDAGAYKCFFENYADAEYLEKYDEIILMNDTFYGPLFGWNQIFECMQQQQVDAWGLSRMVAGYSSVRGEVEPEHIQSYFLAVRNEVIKSANLIQFFKNLDFPKTRLETIKNFEFKFTQWLKSKGYIYTTYLDVMGYQPIEGINPYNKHAYKIIREYKFPIVKRTAFSIGNFIEGRKTLELITHERPYDETMITNHLMRLDKDGHIKLFAYHQIKEFICKYDNVYIYGNGNVGRNIGAYLEYKKWKMKAYVVSSKDENSDSNVVEFKDMNLQHKDGVIIGVMNPKDVGDIYNKLLSVASSEQILKPNVL